MVFSATTAIYVGNTSCSKAYIGTTQVWPVLPTTGYVLEYVEYFSGLTSGDSYVLIAENTKNIVAFKNASGPYGEPHLFTNSSFSAFTGNGIYSTIPEYSAIFRLTNSNYVRLHSDYYDGDAEERAIRHKVAGSYAEEPYYYILKNSDSGTSVTTGFMTLYDNSKLVVGFDNSNVRPLCYCPVVYSDPVILSTSGTSGIEKDYYKVYKLTKIIN